MKRYALFGWQYLKAKGGINDLLATADSIRELQLQVSRHVRDGVAPSIRVQGRHEVDIVQIVDTVTGAPVLTSEWFRESNSEPLQIRWVEPSKLGRKHSPALTYLL